MESVALTEVTNLDRTSDQVYDTTALKSATKLGSALKSSTKTPVKSNEDNEEARATRSTTKVTPAREVERSRTPLKEQAPFRAEEAAAGDRSPRRSVQKSTAKASTHLQSTSAEEQGLQREFAERIEDEPRQENARAELRDERVMEVASTNEMHVESAGNGPVEVTTTEVAPTEVTNMEVTNNEVIQTETHVETNNNEVIETEIANNTEATNVLLQEGHSEIQEATGNEQTHSNNVDQA